jgi:hypothetical protein
MYVTAGYRYPYKSAGSIHGVPRPRLVRWKPRAGTVHALFCFTFLKQADATLASTVLRILLCACFDGRITETSEKRA